MGRNLLLALVGLFLFAVAAPAARAAVRPHAVTLSIGAGKQFFENQLDYRSAPLYSLGIGYNLSSHWAVEGTFGYTWTQKKSDKNFNYNIFNGRVDLLRHFGPDNVFVPYLAVGLGAMVYDAERTREPVNKDGFFDWGLGFKVALGDNVALRVDGRHYILVDNSKFAGTDQNFLATGGLEFQFGGGEQTAVSIDQDHDGVIDSLDRCADTPAGVSVDAFGCPSDADADGVYDVDDKCPGTAPGTTVDQTGCPADSDHDGVIDDLDKCPDTPAKVKVDENGCPLPAPARLDSDGDGVADDLDKCPNTPADVPVNNLGCPRDSDADGVFDVDDKCPGTPAGVAVDGSGCPVPAPAPTSLDLSIKFATDKSAVPASAQPELDKAAAFIVAHPGAHVVIEGHTDNIGPAAYNQKLSQRRANSVRKALIQKFGIPADRIVARGYGESRPVGDNATPEGRLANRRVVVRIEE